MTSIVYQPAPSLAAFFASDAFVSLVSGPVGSGKSSAAMVKIAWHAAKMKPQADGIRRSRCVVVRNTRPMLIDSTLKTFLEWFPDGVMGRWVSKTTLEFLLEFGDVECEVMFRGLDQADDVRRLLSTEVTFGVLDETREIHPDIYAALKGRVGRYPSINRGGCLTEDGKEAKHIWGATNAPTVDTFWANLMTNPPANVAVFAQPSARSPEADWLDKLPSPAYYQDLMEGATDDWVRVYIDNEFGHSLSGQPVFRCFDRATHVAKTLPALLSGALVIGVDAGLNPTATLTQQTCDGRVVVHDAITGNVDGMGALRFIREKLKPLLARKYSPLSPLLVLDPAAWQRAQTDERCVADVFRAEGFRVKPARTNSIAARLAVVEKYMTRTVNGAPGFMVSPAADGLIRALAGGYRYRVNTKGEVEDKPEKAHPASDYCFIAGTPVLTPAGYAPMESLRAGDTVCVPDGMDTVTAVGSRVAPELVRVVMSDGATLTCTPEHPFVAAEGVTRAIDLQGGAAVETVKGNLALRVLRVEALSHGGVVHNLTTKRTHLYYAGAALVHNCDSLQYACLHHDGGETFGWGGQAGRRQEVKRVEFAWT
jgi:hypothetical protein